jgi:hypothetical protein
MQSNLFDTEPEFGWESIRSQVSQYQYTQATKEYYTRTLEMITLFEETKQKCFKVVAEGYIYCNGHRDDIYYVFPTCIVLCSKDGGNIHVGPIHLHTLSVLALQCLKLSKLSYGQGTHRVLTIFQSFDESIQEKFKKEMDYIIDDCEIEKQVVRTDLAMYKGLAEKYRKELYDERLAFEKEKRTLETEMTKYKDIVENCRKEISSYGF